MPQKIVTQSINLHTEEIICNYKKSSRTKSIRIDVLHTGEIQVILPHRVSYKEAELFVRAKSAWIIKSRDYFLNDVIAVVPDPLPHQTYYAVKHRSKKMVHDLLKQYNAHYNFTYNRIAVRQQKSKWGSCSSKGNLNFNYKIFFLPEALAHYLIVHELCHLKEMNHSDRFWRLVGETIPDVREKAQLLRRHIP